MAGGTGVEWLVESTLLCCFVPFCRLKEEKKKKKEKKPVVGAEYGNEDFSGDSVSRPVSNATTLVGSDRLSFTSTDTQGTLTSDDNDKSASTPSVQLEEVQR